MLTIEEQATRYRWLRDNGHLDSWWSIQGPSDKAKNIDADIDTAMAEQAIKQSTNKPTFCHRHG